MILKSYRKRYIDLKKTSDTYVYILYESMYVKFLERENYRDRRPIVDWEKSRKGLQIGKRELLEKPGF